MSVAYVHRKSIYCSDLQISRLRQDYDKKEKDLRDDHEEELKHVQLQAEDELQEVLFATASLPFLSMIFIFAVHI